MTQESDAAVAAPIGGLFADYAPPASAHDELLNPDGTLRPGWPALIRSLARSGRAGLVDRGERVQRLLRENGVTSNVFGTIEDLQRPWELDPIPLLLADTEWQPVARGIEQRARLLNLLLQDVYGQQSLFRAGVLPAPLLFEHPGFLRPCHGINLPGNLHLHIYAAQLARRADGRWTVLADRTQGPSGSGYAVEDRLIISRTLPDDFHELQVERLAPYFVALRETLAALAPRNQDNPRVVLLSPGAMSSRYFEDTYLARYLGYALVEGGDLSVRSDGVFLKSLGGLLPVDVIFRRVNDEDSDPLELKSSSLLGVPGLLESVRAGQVAIGNALGSGFLEAPALQAFMPQICRSLLHEELIIPGVATWWGGRPDDLQYIEHNFESLVIRPAYQHRLRRSQCVALLNAEERAKLLAAIRARPRNYIAQDSIERSTAPAWDGTALRPAHVTLRAFAVATKGRYFVMPGGLARASRQADPQSDSILAGERSKDVWILSSRPVEPVTLLKRNAKTLELRRSVNDLPSRVADQLYWLGRLAERAEARVRHLRSIVLRLTGDLQAAEQAALHVLVEALGEPAVPLSKPGDVVDDPWGSLCAGALRVIYESRHPGSLGSVFRALLRTASAIRDRISVDSWHLFNELNIPDSPESFTLQNSLPLLNRSLTLLTAFVGLSTESMTRGPGWRFLDVGRRLERALQTIDRADAILVEDTTELLPRIEAMLEIADSSMTYRYRYLSSLQLPPVLDLLIVDETNPRAVGFQLRELSEHVRQLASIGPARSNRREQHGVLAAQGNLRLADVEALSTVDESGERILLREFLERMATSLRVLSTDLTETYLTHTVTSRVFGTATAG